MSPHRCPPPGAAAAPSSSAAGLPQQPPVTIIRPLCGLDAFEEATLRSTFELDYPQLEILLCCASANDPVVPLASG